MSTLDVNKSITSLSVCDGKYTFLKVGYRIHVLRHDEPWLVLEKGQNAIAALMQTVLGLVDLVNDLKKPRWVYHAGEETSLYVVNGKAVGEISGKYNDPNGGYWAELFGENQQFFKAHTEADAREWVEKNCEASNG